MAGWYPRFGLAALLVGMSLVAYAPAYQAGFVDFDDSDYVLSNPHVASGLSGENVHWSLTSYHSSNWHPLTWISHMLDIELFGLDPRGHHVVNVALHAANAALLFLLLAYMTENVGASFLVAALFAVHPINVESVAWISQRKTTLSTLFGILAIWCYAAYARRRDWRMYAGSLALFAASLMAKQTLVTLPFALLLLDYWPLARKEMALPAKSLPTWSMLLRGWWRLVPDKLPYLALAVLASVVTMLVQHEALNTIEKLPLETRLGNVAISYVAYLGKLFWPVHLAVFYPLYNEDVTPSRVVLALAVLGAITAACAYFGRQRRYLITGWFWYLGTMVPVIGLVHVGAQSMADRYAYISFWGLWVIIVWGARDLWLAAFQRVPARGVVVAGGICLFGLLSWMTYAQAAKWHDTISLFEDAVADADRNWKAHRVLADHYLGQGDYKRCLDHCERGAACGRELGHLFSTEGRALFDTGATEQALQKLKQAVEVDPKNSLAHANLGWALSELGKYEPASAQLATAASLLDEESTPYSRQIVFSNWGATLAQLNRPEESLQKFDLALQVSPNSAVLLRDSSAVALRVGNVKDAMDRLRRAEQLEPGSSKTALLFGQAYVATGDLNAARESFERVLQRVPNQPDAILQLAQTLVRLGRREEAIAKLAAAATALQKIEEPNARVARSRILTRLANVYSAGGQPDRAIEQYDQALAAWGDNFQANNNLGWLLATHPEETRRNGKRAVELARHACELLEAPTPAVLGTMAAAYAANGQLPEAVVTAEKAQTQARKAGDQAVVASLEEQLKAYRSGKLYLGQ